MRAPVFLAFVLSAGAAGATLYDELGVDQQATSSEIRQAYRKLALKFHPDKHQQGDESIPFEERTARFIRICEAYEVLSNADKRAAYDAKLRSSWSSSSRGGAGGVGGTDYSFSFSLKDAFEVLERFLGAHLSSSTALGGRYMLAKAALSAWPGFTMPLPELLQSSLLRQALDIVDWSAVGMAAKKALTSAFVRARPSKRTWPAQGPQPIPEQPPKRTRHDTRGPQPIPESSPCPPVSLCQEKEDGSLDWAKVATAGAAGAALVASALDAADDGNRTAVLGSLAAKALSWLSGTSKGAGKDET